MYPSAAVVFMMSGLFPTNLYVLDIGESSPFPSRLAYSSSHPIASFSLPHLLHDYPSYQPGTRFPSPLSPSPSSPTSAPTTIPRPKTSSTSVPSLSTRPPDPADQPAPPATSCTPPPHPMPTRHNDPTGPSNGQTPRPSSSHQTASHSTQTAPEARGPVDSSPASSHRRG